MAFSLFGSWGVDPIDDGTQLHVTSGQESDVPHRQTGALPHNALIQKRCTAAQNRLNFRPVSVAVSNMYSACV